jgi:alpha-L-fucosidase
LKKSGLKTGLYFSPIGAIRITISIHGQKNVTNSKMIQTLAEFYQLLSKSTHELSSQYSPDLLWFDGDWEHFRRMESSQTLNLLKKYNPDIIINSRLKIMEIMKLLKGIR